jgi:hypothetical protein
MDANKGRRGAVVATLGDVSRGDEGDAGVGPRLVYLGRVVDLGTKSPSEAV